MLCYRVHKVAEAHCTLIDLTTKFIYDENATKMILYIGDITDTYRFILSPALEQFLGLHGHIGYQKRLLAYRAFELNRV